MIRHSNAKHLGCPIISSALSVQQADGSSQLQVVRELQITFTRNNTELVPLLWKQTTLLCDPLKERFSLAMALSTHMGLGSRQVPYQLFVELLYSVLLLPPRLFGPENS